MTASHPSYRRNPSSRKAERRRSVLGALWNLMFPLNDRFFTYQQRRNWRARAGVFFVLGALTTLVVIWFIQGRGLLVIHLAR